jgi:quercetin dioxygenase-like cupin family protein
VLSAKPFQLGKLTGVIMDFPEVGDVLAMHQHQNDTNHMTVVARGSFRIHGSGWEKVATCGEVLDFEPNDPHEFVSLEPGSRVVNIVKG